MEILLNQTIIFKQRPRTRLRHNKNSGQKHAGHDRYCLRNAQVELRKRVVPVGVRGCCFVGREVVIELMGDGH